MFNLFKAQRRRRRRGYVPTVDGLETKQLMDGSYLIGNGVMFSFTDPDGKFLDKPMDNMLEFRSSVGTPFSIQVKEPDSASYTISRIEYSTPHSLSGSSRYGDTINESIAMPGSVSEGDGLLYDGNGDGKSSSLSGYHDNFFGTQVITVTVDYQSTDGIPAPARRVYGR